jgi:tetratricopeptide (TPR) repeat protein
MRKNRIGAVKRLGITLLVPLLCFVASHAFAGSKAATTKSSMKPVALLTESTSPSLKRAVRAWHRDNYEMAIRHTDVALGHKLLRADLELALAISCVLRGETGEIQAGLAHCDRLVELTDARDGRYLNSRGNARMRSGDVENAILDYRAALTLAGESGTFGMAEHKLVERNLARAMHLGDLDGRSAVASTEVKYRPMRRRTSATTMPVRSTAPPAAPSR